MFKRGVFSIALLLIACSAIAQQPHLVRYHQYQQDSSQTINDVMCRYIRSAHVSQNNGLLRVYDFVPAETDLIFFELVHFAQLQVAIEMKRGAAKIKNPTAYWVNNFYLMSIRKHETKDFLTGELTLKHVGNSEVIVNGRLNIDTDYPSTHQEIIFNQTKLKISTLSEVTEQEDDEQAAERREDEIVMKLSSIVSEEKKLFLDSVSLIRKHLEPGERSSGPLEIMIGDKKIAFGYPTFRDSLLSKTDVSILEKRITKKLKAFLESQKE